MAATTVTIATPHDLPDLLRFFRAVAAAEYPDDSEAAARGAAGLQDSLSAWDFLRSDTCFLLLARVTGAPFTSAELAKADVASGDRCTGDGPGSNGAPAGYILAVRIPKADARVGFLFVDEVYTLPAYRRLGVARALLERAQSLAGELGLAGVRLLVRGENEAARTLYRACGFTENETVFGQWEGTRDKAA